MYEWMSNTSMPKLATNFNTLILLFLADETGDSTSALIGIIIGAILGVILFILALFFCLWKNKHRHARYSSEL